MSGQVPAPYYAHHTFTVGDDVAFAHKRGVARGKVMCVHIVIAPSKVNKHRSETEVNYTIAVHDTEADRGMRNEHAREEHVTRSLDDAWKLYERGIK